VLYAASYLSNIEMLWWQPTLVTHPKPLIQGDWGEIVDQLNVYFWQPNLAQASKHALKMHKYQHVNKYMIEFFSEHATHTDGMMQLYMVSSIRDLLSASRISSCHWITPKHSNNSTP